MDGSFLLCPRNTSVARAPMQPSAFERDEPRLIERPQGAAAALLRDATQAGSQPAGPSHSHGSASSSAPGASAGAQMYLCGGACGSMLEMTAFSKAQLKKHQVLLVLALLAACLLPAIFVLVVFEHQE